MPENGSAPMNPNHTPRQSMISPFNTGPVDVTAMITRLKNITAAISGGPNPRTMAATGMIITSVNMSLKVSEIAEE